MKRTNDQIFQLSLTEIAFTLVFILLLLFGYMLAKADASKKELEQALLAAGTLQQNRQMLEEARAELTRELVRAGAKPDEVISSLLSQSKLIQERDELRKRVDNLDNQLSALTEVKNLLNSTRGGPGDRDVVQKQITEALTLKAKLEQKLKDEESQQVAPSAPASVSLPASAATVTASSIKQATAHSSDRYPLAASDIAAQALAGLVLKGEVEKQMRNQLNRPYVSGQEPILAEELVSARKQVEVLGTNVNVGVVTKENANLRGQLAYLKARLDARGGRDYPPCWADEKTGKVEFLFIIEIAPDGLHITPSWPDSRKQDAAALPGIDKLTSAHALTLSEFAADMQGIDRSSKAKECRHYVYIRNRVTDLDSFNRQRYAIENFFYKLELRS